MDAYKQCHFYTIILIPTFYLPFLFRCASTGHGVSAYYSPSSDLCADVYGLRNLIVQMGHKDDVGSRRRSRAGDAPPAAVSAASRVFAFAHVSSLKY